MKLSEQHMKLLQIALVIALVVGVYYYLGHKTETKAAVEGMHNAGGCSGCSGCSIENLQDVDGNELPEDEAKIEQLLAPQPEVELPPASETALLPKYDESDQFAKDHPVTALLREQNYLIGGHHNGINSTLQSNKIPYLDIRELPPIIKEDVGPWNNSSYEQAPGATRRGFVLN
jgi:hypothetical protein